MELHGKRDGAGAHAAHAIALAQREERQSEGSKLFTGRGRYVEDVVTG